MSEITGAFAAAIQLIVLLDPQFVEIVGRSLAISLAALLIAGLIGLPLGSVIAVTRFPGRRLAAILLNGFMGLPPVVVGLVVYLALSRSGPLGTLGLLFSPAAMIIAQICLITPIVAALSRQTIEDLHVHYDEQLRSLGVGVAGQVATLLWEGRRSLLTALLAGFGRASSEVGAVLIVGGNIDHVTRVMTTAIALETSRGNLALALGLGIVVLVIAISVNAVAAAIGETDRGAHG